MALLNRFSALHVERNFQNTSTVSVESSSESADDFEDEYSVLNEDSGLSEEFSTVVSKTKKRLDANSTTKAIGYENSLKANDYENNSVMPVLPNGAASSHSVTWGFNELNGVLMVYGLTASITCDYVFNLFCLYGNVVKINFLAKKRGCAMVQMGDEFQARTALECLDGCVLFGSELQVKKSLQEKVTIGSAVFTLESKTPNWKDYTKSPNNRFMTMETARNNALEMHCSRHGVTISASAVTFLDRRSAKGKYGLITFATVEEATDALVMINNTAITYPKIGVVSRLRLCFSHLIHSTKPERSVFAQPTVMSTLNSDGCGHESLEQGRPSFVPEEQLSCTFCDVYFNSVDECRDHLKREPHLTKTATHLTEALSNSASSACSTMSLPPPSQKYVVNPPENRTSQNGNGVTSFDMFSANAAASNGAVVSSMPVLVRNVNSFSFPGLIELYFKNYRSGGGPFLIPLEFHMSSNMGTFQYTDPQHAQNVLNKEFSCHKLEGRDLYVSIAPPFSSRHFAIVNVPPALTLDSVVNYFEARTKADTVCAQRSRDGTSIVLGFQHTLDIELLMESVKQRGMMLADSSVYFPDVSRVRLPDAALLRPLPLACHSDTVLFAVEGLFENVQVRSVVVDSISREALVIFSDWKDAEKMFGMELRFGIEVAKFDQYFDTTGGFRF